MTKEEKQKAIYVLEKSAPVMPLTQEEFNGYVQTINQVIDWLEQETVSKESYDHEYFLRKEFEMKIARLEQELTAKNDLGVDCISRADALRVAKNEYLRGWHNALCKALSEKHSIHCEEGNFSVIQEETITGLGLSMNCAVSKDAESYMSTIPSITPQEPRWIPVTERLPKEGGDYLVTLCFDIFDKETVREVRRNFFCILSKKWLYEDKDVIAWQPLPKPYKAESERVIMATKKRGKVNGKNDI